MPKIFIIIFFFFSAFIKAQEVSVKLLPKTINTEESEFNFLQTNEKTKDIQKTTPELAEVVAAINDSQFGFSCSIKNAAIFSTAQVFIIKYDAPDIALPLFIHNLDLHICLLGLGD